MNAVSERRSVLRKTRLAYAEYLRARPDNEKSHREALNWNRERKGVMKKKARVVLQKRKRLNAAIHLTIHKHQPFRSGVDPRKFGLYTLKDLWEEARRDLRPISLREFQFRMTKVPKIKRRGSRPAFYVLDAVWLAFPERKPRGDQLQLPLRHSDILRSIDFSTNLFPEKTGEFLQHLESVKYNP